MLTFFRRLSKSKFGTGIIAAFFLLILVGFAMSDLTGVGSGNIGFGMGSSNLAQVGSQAITEQEMSDAMQRRLQQERQTNPEADYSSIAGEFDRILSALIDQRALIAFAEKSGFRLSKRLIDAEIAQLPQTRGLNGQFSEEAYQAFLAQQRLTDTQVREIIAGGLLERLMFAPVVANSRVSVGMATPYASMLLEAREGEVAAIPVDVFKRGLNPSDADLQRYYAANRTRYMVPEQRTVRMARIGPEQVANVTASDQEIAAQYNANRAAYAPKETRVLTQAVVQDQRAASAIAARAKAGSALSAAGANAAVSSLGPQTRAGYASIAGDRAAAAVFSAPAGAVVGPVQSEFGWAVVKVESVRTEGGKTLAEARPEIAAKVTADKRKAALEELVERVQSAVDDGGNFAEAAGQAKLPVTTTPLIMANGRSRTDASYKVAPELDAALKVAFEIAANDPPEIVSLAGDNGYVLVSPGEVVPSAPAPLQSIRDRVAGDWLNSEASRRARAVAVAIDAKVRRGVPLAQALKEAGTPLPAVRPMAARRIEIANAQGVVPPPLRMLFSLTSGKSGMAADPQGRGFFIVKVGKIVPGNALLQPALISRMQNELQQAAAQDYASQFLNAIREQMKIRRNESAIAANKQRLITGGS